MQDLIIKTLDDIRGSWRFRWIAVAAAWAICVAGWAYVMTMPNIYEANARVYVDSRTVLGPLLRGLAIDPNVESELAVVRQALLSRPQLETVARKADLDLRAKTPQEMESLINSLRERITVATDYRSRSSADGLYRITFTDRSREKSLAVVDTLLNTFVEETLGSKRTGQESAQRFIDEQIADYERRLTEAEQRLADFKRRNVGAMPGSDGDYFARLQAEMGSVDQLRRNLSLAETRREEIRRQLSGETPVIFGINAGSGGQRQEAGDLNSRIQEMEGRLEEMLLRYTEKHPEVIALQDTLAELRQRQHEELERISRGEGASGSLSSSLASNPIYRELQADLNRAEIQIAELRHDLAQRSARVDELRRLIDTVPEVEAELARLNRDYDITRARYLELVERRETAKLSDSAERQGTVKFQIIDPPAVGFEPIAPNRALMLVAVLVFAIGAGGALAYLLNMLRPVYQNTRMLASHTGLPVLGCVSRTRTEADVARARWNTLALSGAVGLLILVCAVVVLFNEAGVQLAQRVVSSV